jgi:hypothetical protein
MTSFLRHPLFRISTAMLIIGAFLVSCEYGPKHGRIHQMKNKSASMQQALSMGGTEDFTESDLRFDRKPVVVTSHGRCRMRCREIDAFEVQEILDQDKVNESKSTYLVSSGKCPKIAYEGYTRDKQHVRVILGDCKDDPLIITVIDLENDYDCHCD